MVSDRMDWMVTLNRWRGRVPAVYHVQSAAGLQRDWTFTRSYASPGVKLRRLRALTGVRPAPACRELSPVRPSARWTGYFMYLPHGQLTPAHRFTLARLRGMDRRLLVVCAAPSVTEVPPELAAVADALWWKALPGFDFSGYAVALSAIAAKSPGAELIMLNDSVLGPFDDLTSSMSDTPWDFTGLTAFSLVENHVQSYAFTLREVTPATVRRLSSVMVPRVGFDAYADVIYLQETRLARVASTHGMSVGARWFAQAPDFGDPTIFSGLSLLEQGFPFMKRSLLTRHPDLYPAADLLAYLEAKGHPLQGLPAPKTERGAIAA